jgi:polysaccharide chain length determinant protein (PEP-CTERM system associated)
VEQTFVDHLRGMWSRGLSAAWIVAAVGVAAAMLVPQRYEANARLQVDTLTLLKPALAGLSIEPNLDQRVAFISRTLLNRSNLEKLLDAYDPHAGSAPAADREEIMDRLARTIQISGNATTNIYSITYRDTDPKRAQAVVSSLVQILLNTSAGGKRQDSRSALAFLDEQIARYEQSLHDAQNRLEEFRLKHAAGQGATPAQDHFARLSKSGDEVASAKLELRSAIESRDAYRRALKTQAHDARFALQKARLDELLRNYTDQHPDVIATRRAIAELEANPQDDDALSIPTAGATLRPGEPADRFPALQQIRSSLTEADAKVAAAQAKVQAYQAQLAQVSAEAKLIPEAEATLAQLTRDYDVQKKTYTDLLARREATLMSASAQDNGAEQIRVVDPARVSPRPVQATRTVLLFGAFVGALGAGVLASFLADKAVPTFSTAHALATGTERPLLGTLSLLRNDAAWRRRRRGVVLFAGGLGALAACFIGILTLMVAMGRLA